LIVLSSAQQGEVPAFPSTVRVTHGFHRLFGRELEFVKRRRNWDADRVYVYDDGGGLVSVPVEWTDVVAEDPFVVIAAGRCPFRVEDLRELAGLVERLRCQPPIHDPEL
jgi:hypothetical protein